MAINLQASATAGYLFNRSMYYAKIMEGILESSMEYQREFVNDIYNGLYGDDAKVYYYSYLFNKTYDELYNKHSLLDSSFVDIDNHIYNIDQFLASNDVINSEQFEILYKDFKNSMDSIYAEFKSTDKFGLEVDSLDTLMGYSYGLYRYNNDYYVKYDNLIDKLEYSHPVEKQFSGLLNIYNVLLGYQTNIRNNILDESFTYYNGHQFNGVSISNNTFTYLFDSPISKSILIENDSNIKSIDATIPYKHINEVYNSLTGIYDYLTNGNLLLSINTINHSSIISMEFTDSSLSIRLLDGSIKSTTLENYETIYPEDIYSNNYLKEIRDHTLINQKDKPLISYSGIKFTLFSCNEYSTKPNDKFQYTLNLFDETSNEFGISMYNTVYNNSENLNSLPYRVTYESSEPIGNYNDILLDFGITEFDNRLSTLFYKSEKSNYRYYTDNEKFYDFSITLDNYYSLTKLKSFKLNDLSMDVTLDYWNSETNQETEQSFKITYNGYTDEYLGYTIDNIINTGINTFNIEYSNGTVDTIVLKNVDEFIVSNNFKTDLFDIHNIELKNSVNIYDVINVISNRENTVSDKLNGEKIIQSFSTGFYEYSDIFSTYTSQNRIYTNNNKEYNVNLKDEIVNFKRLKFSQQVNFTYLTDNPSNDNQYQLSETLKFYTDTNSVELHRDLPIYLNYFSVDNYRIQNNIVNFDIQFKDTTIPIKQVVSNANLLTNVLQDNNTSYLKTYFLYNFDFNHFKEYYGYSDSLQYLSYGLFAATSIDSEESKRYPNYNYDEITLYSNYSLVSSDSNNDIIVTTSKTNQKYTIEKNSIENPEEFNEKILDYLDKSYRSELRTEDSIEPIKANYDEINQRINFKSNNGDQGIYYIVDSESGIFEIPNGHSNYNGTYTSIDNQNNLFVTLKIMISVYLNENYGIKQSIQIPGGNKVINIGIKNPNNQKIRCILSLTDDSRFSNGNFGTSFLTVNENSEVMDNLIQLVSGKNDTKCIIMSLDY